MSEVIGKISWITDKPVEFPKESGKFNLPMKINNIFYNKFGEVPKLKVILEKLKTGYEVKLDVDGAKILKIEVLKETEAPKKTENKSTKKSGKWEDDIVTFETLLTDMHSKHKDNFSIETEMLSVDLEKSYALFKAKVTIHGKVERVFEGHGDATALNVGELVKQHFIRMAETRSIVRALRWATNNGCAEEEK